ncbi:Telomere repeats-binding bouquet formation protein 2 [Bagarius yarrelli]|uniref:Telomere repeats-binding bouquet formation protein 2 n=1 Tax=Bagarius yarrelli TaxID=175774 RepID=A0A556V3V2_BAGYA|nr:Telomere repeats-binding bouquet formation protein 2 [Bagarius yarrelli]
MMLTVESSALCFCLICVEEVKSRIGRFIWEQDEMLGVTTPHGNRSRGQILSIRDDSEESMSEKEKKRQESCVNTSPSRDEAVCCEAQLYPVNNMVSGFVHIDQLRKFSGELHDFLPSHSGYSVSRSHSRRLPYHY